MSINFRDYSGSSVSVMTATLGADQVQQIGWAKSSRSDTYTTTANGTTVDVSSLGMSKFGIQIKCTTATATLWDIRLEVSLDGTNFTTLLTHSSAGGDADGAVKFSPGGAQYPALYFRTRCAAVTLGSATNIVVTVVGMP